MPRSSDATEDRTLTADEAAALLGRSRQWVFNLVRDGWIEKQAKGKYTLASVIRGAVTYYEDQTKRTTKTAAASRVTDARAAEIELRIAERKRELIPLDDAMLAQDLIVGAVLNEFDGQAARVTRDMKLRRLIEADVHAAKTRIAKALAQSKRAARTGRFDDATSGPD